VHFGVSSISAAAELDTSGHLPQIQIYTAITTTSTMPPATHTAIRTVLLDSGSEAIVDTSTTGKPTYVIELEFRYNNVLFNPRASITVLMVTASVTTLMVLDASRAAGANCAVTVAVKTTFTWRLQFARVEVTNAPGMSSVCCLTHKSMAQPKAKFRDFRI